MCGFSIVRHSQVARTKRTQDELNSELPSHRILSVTEEELARYFAPYSAQILAGGHTHVQMVRRYRDALLINPGSVGLPWEKAHSSEDLYNPLRAEYAVLTIEGGDLRVELRRVTYPFDGLAAAVHDQTMPHAEWWLSDWR